MDQQKTISNNSFEEIVNFDPTLCLYLDLVNYNVKSGFLEKDVQDLVEKIIEEDHRIKKVSLAIKNLSKYYLVSTVCEFLRIYMFDEFCNEIKKSVKQVIFKDNHNLQNLEVYVLIKHNDQIEYCNQNQS